MNRRTKSGPLWALIAVGVVLAASAALAQAPKKGAGKAPAKAPAKAGAAQPKFKAIWEPVNYKQDIQLSDVHFVSDTVGWVTGENGTLLKTTDGGDTWTAVLGGEAESKDDEIRMLRFLDRKSTRLNSSHIQKSRMPSSA